MHNSDTLAISGGPPVRTGHWPAWPISAPGLAEALAEVCRQPRWALSGPYAGAEALVTRFASAFASFNEVPFCVATTSGTASLTIALEALGIGPGDEVLVPGLTWVACPSVVANLNATPVLVDVDPDTLCMDPRAAAAAITPRTRAIMVVHLYSAVADMDAIADLARLHGLALLEDCAQAHGARWRGKRVGTIGDAGTFSMQNGKVLTAGEGGAVITSDPELHESFQQLHADGRVLTRETPVLNELELIEIGRTPGNNWCLSEFQAAVLLRQLELLDAQNLARAQAAQLLAGEIGGDGWFLQGTSAGTTQRTYYQFVVGFRPEDFKVGTDIVSRALSAELGIRFSQTYRPLNCHPLYQPERRRRWIYSDQRRADLDVSRFDLVECKRAHGRFVVFPHQYLLGSEADISDIACAFKKITRNLPELRKIS